MNKFVSILLALAMILALSIPVSAAENTTLTIYNSKDRTYNGYQLLKLTTSLNCDETHTHEDDCYNYAYTVNEKYEAILQDLAGEGDIIAYLNGLTSDSDSGYGSLRAVADSIYRTIQEENIEPDAPNLDGSDTIAQGYWLFADVSTLTGNATKSLVMVDTKGQDALTIRSKVGLPTVDKKVKDIEDSEDDKILDNAWHDSADHDIGDTVPFKLTATLASNAHLYTTYAITFHDTMSAGLTLNEGSFKVYMYDSKHKADADTDLNDFAKDVTDNFTVTTTAGGFSIGCENVFAIEGATKDSAFVVYYEATLNNSAVIGAAGNPNEVYLQYSNDPYGDSTGKTETDKVTVFTYQLIINKTDSHGHELEGAGFTLYKKNLAGEWIAIGTEQIGDHMTTFTWKGLDDGDYKLEESTVPEGYNKMSDVVFSISATHVEVDADPTLTALDGGLMGTGVVDTGVIEKNIINNTGTILPETGAEGTFLLITGGTVLVILAAVFMITRKKMSIYED